MKLIFVFLIFLTFSSCQNNRNEKESEYQKCINDKTFGRVIHFPEGSPVPDVLSSISVFDSIKKFEHYLQKTGHLVDLSKNDYLSFLTEINKAEFLKKEFEAFNSIHSFIQYNLMNSLFFEELFYDCAMSSFKNQIHYNFLFETKDKVQYNNSYPNKKILTELVNKVDFRSETQRLIITYLIYGNLYWRYEME